MILTLEKATKVALNGKQILKNVGFGLYQVSHFLHPCSWTALDAAQAPLFLHLENEAQGVVSRALLRAELRVSHQAP